MSANLAGNILDLFSGAAGGWSLGMHRAGFRTVAACEVIPWRRALYSVNNPAVRLYDDILTLTADRIVSDLGYLPDVVVGSPPCQDISSANTKGKGVDGDRSKLFFEAIRLVGECRPRWVALENSANLRTRGADRVLGALEDLGYSAWPFVVGAVHVGANHERLRAWIIAFDTAQIGHDGGRPWGYGPDGDGETYPRGFVGFVPNADEARQSHGSVVASLRQAQEPHDRCSSGRRDAVDLADAAQVGRGTWPGNDESQHSGDDGLLASNGFGDGFNDVSDASQDGRRAGRQGRRLEPTAGLFVKACGDGPHAHKDGEHDSAVDDEMGERAGVGGNVGEPWPEWNGGFANHLRMDDGLSAWVADTRVEIGLGRGASAASLIVEALGDAVIPEITYRIGRSIRRVETALAAIHRAAA
jgi:DNA (cytosine-5)-methyltransferase 1